MPPGCCGCCRARAEDRAREAHGTELRCKRVVTQIGVIDCVCVYVRVFSGAGVIVAADRMLGEILSPGVVLSRVRLCAGSGSGRCSWGVAGGGAQVDMEARVMLWRQ